MAEVTKSIKINVKLDIDQDTPNQNQHVLWNAFKIQFMNVMECDDKWKYFTGDYETPGKPDFEEPTDGDPRSVDGHPQNHRYKCEKNAWKKYRKDLAALTRELQYARTYLINALSPYMITQLRTLSADFAKTPKELINVLESRFHHKSDLSIREYEQQLKTIVIEESEDVTKFATRIQNICANIVQCGGEEPSDKIKRNALLDGLHNRFDFASPAMTSQLMNIRTLKEIQDITFDVLVDTIRT